MKKLISFALTTSFLFSKTLVVDVNLVCLPFFGCSACTDGDDYYYTVSDALSNANSGDEIVICDGDYKESNLKVEDSNLYIYSYSKDPTKVKIYDNSGDPIFNIKNSGLRLEDLSIVQDSNQIDINVSAYINDNFNNGVVKNLYFKDLNITSEGKGIVFKYNIDNNFSDVNITSKDVCFESDWSEFHGVNIKNSEFNQTSSGKYAFLTWASNFYDNNFSNLDINSSGYGAYFGYGIKDSNFTNFYINSNDDSFIVNSGNIYNIRFVDSNLSSGNGRGFSINDGNLTNSYFDDFNISSDWEGVYTYEDINNSVFSNFIINASTAFYADEYIRKSTFKYGEINATYQGIYSDKEFNQSTIDNLKINAANYGLWFSENSTSGAINDENNLTNLNITQTSDSDTRYSGIKFRKKVNNTLFQDINMSVAERGIWLSTGGYYNTFNRLELNSSEGQSFVNSGLIYKNSFTNIKTNSYKVSFSFRGDVEYNTFDTLNLHSDIYSGMYNGNTDDYIIGNKFNNITINSQTYGIYFKSDCSDNNYTNLYIRVNKYKGLKFGTYSRGDYFYNIDTNGTKGLDFNISEGDIIRKINAYATKNEAIYFITIQTNPVKMYDLNLTSTQDNCIYVDNLNDDLNISTIDFDNNDFNCSDYNGIQISADSTNSLEVKNTKFTFNADSSDTSRALIKASSLNTLYLENNIFDASNLRKGIYITSSVDNFYAYDNNLTNLDDTGIYLNQVNTYLDIEDNNISNSSSYGIYVDSVGSNFNKGEIKGNIFKNCGDYAVNLFYGNETDVTFEVWKNCFYNNGGSSSQAYTYDSVAQYDDGSVGNYWSDWSGSGDYAIDPIPIYDHHPRSKCDFNNQNYSFNAVSKIIYNDAVKDWDNNLTTKIVNNSFSTYILSKNSDTNTSEEANITKVVFMYYNDGGDNDCSGVNEANQTICDDSTSTNCPDTNSSGEVEISNININRAVKCIKIHIEGIGASGAEVQEANSTDDFAVRPKEFNITNIPNKIYAGSEFNLTVRAFDENKNNSKDYNESLSLNNSVKVETNVTNSNCVKGDFNLTNGGNFKDGETNATFKYSEVGELNISVKEVAGSEFAIVDEDDTNWSERSIKENSAILTFVPHHFDANVSVSNFDTYFTYLDNNLSIYSLIDLNITAKNEDNQTTKNYNIKCAAKDVDVNLTPYIYRHNEVLNKDVLYKVIYVDDNSSVYKNSKINFIVGESNFTTDDNGSAFVKVYVNFDRNSSNPENPFEYNISEVNVTNNDVNLTYFTSNGNSLFFYGNLNMNDITTYKDDFNITHDFVLYDDNESDTYIPDKNKEILLYWFLNLYNKTKDANISNFVVTKSYVYKSDDEISSVSVNVNEINDTLSLNVKRNDSNVVFAVVHIIDSNASHLWYSKFGNDYNISLNSSCANHFCFSITWERNESNESEVITGDINGTKAEVNSSKTHKTGVKIFR